MLLALAGAAGAATPLPEGVVRAPAPDWIEPVAAEGLPATEARNGLAYVLVDDQLTTLPATPERYRRLVFDVAGREGLENAGRLSIGFLPGDEQVRLHALRIVRNGGVLERLDEAGAELLRKETRADEGILDGERTLELVIPDVRVGDRLDLAFSIVGSRGVFGGDFHRAFTTGYSQPVALRRLLGFAPATRPLRWRLSGGWPGHTVGEQVQGSRQRLELRASPSPRVIEESGAPAWFDGHGHVDLSTSADWAAVAAWSLPLYRIDAAGEAAAAAVVADLGLRGRPAAEVLDAALPWVQREVRYLSLGLGANAYSPAPPATTLARRFGDCKDKALLLIAILRAAGIPAEPVLVSTTLRRTVADHLPTPLAFDHVIVRARLDDDWVYVDPTRDVETAVAGEREPVRYETGLPIAAGSADLVAIPATRLEGPAIDVLQQVAVLPADAEAGGTRRASMHVRTVYRRGHADGTRAHFRNSGAEQVGRDYLAYMQGMYRDIRMDAAPTFEDEPAGNRFVVDEHYAAAFRPDEDAPRAIGDLDLMLFQIADWVPRAREGERRWPLALKGPEYGVHEIRMDVAGGWDIDAAEELVENAWFSFRHRVHVDGDTLVVRGEWRRHVDAIPAADYAVARRDLHRVRDLLNYPVQIGGGVTAKPAREDLPPGALVWPALALAGSVILLLIAWRLRRRSDFAGMLFAPRATAVRVAERRGPGSAVLLVLLYGTVSALAVPVSAWLAGTPMDWLEFAKAFAMPVPALALLAAFVRVVLKLLGEPAAYRRLFVTGGWAHAPLLLLTPFVLLAAGPMLVLIADGATVPGGAVAAVLVLVCVLAALGAFTWSAIAWIGAIAGAAPTSLLRAVAAYVLAAGALFVLTFLIVLGILIPGLLTNA